MGIEVYWRLLIIINVKLLLIWLLIDSIGVRYFIRSIKKIRLGWRLGSNHRELLVLLRLRILI